MFLLYMFDDTSSLDRGWKIAVAFIAVAQVLAIIPLIVFVTARVLIKSEDKIPEGHLYGWPLGIAFVASLGLIAQTASNATYIRVSAYVISLLMAVFGCLGSWLWRRLAYDHDQKAPNQTLEPTSTAVTPPAIAGDRASGARGSS